MTVAALSGRVLDTTAILYLATGTTLDGRAFVRAAVARGATLAVPAAALAAAWALSAPAGRLFLDILLDLSVVVVDPLDTPTARAIGRALTGSRQPLDAGHVIATARARGWPVVTAEPDRLRTLASDVDTEPLP
jgi:hypothetical protein